MRCEVSCRTLPAPRSVCIAPAGVHPVPPVVAVAAVALLAEEHRVGIVDKRLQQVLLGGSNTLRRRRIAHGLNEWRVDVRRTCRSSLRLRIHQPQIGRHDIVAQCQPVAVLHALHHAISRHEEEVARVHARRAAKLCLNGGHRRLHQRSDVPQRISAHGSSAALHLRVELRELQYRLHHRAAGDGAHDQVRVLVAVPRAECAWVRAADDEPAVGALRTAALIEHARLIPLLKPSEVSKRLPAVEQAELVGGGLRRVARPIIPMLDRHYVQSECVCELQRVEPRWVDAGAGVLAAEEEEDGRGGVVHELVDHEVALAVRGTR